MATFTKKHVLIYPSTEERIAEICSHFEELDRKHYSDTEQKICRLLDYIEKEEGLNV